MATERQTPDGVMLRDGYSSKICPESNPDIAFWEKTVKPFGLDAGDPIDITTMFNTRMRTFALRQLVTATDGSMKVAYDPKVYDEIIAILGINQLWTIHFPDGSTEDIYAGLRSFTPSELQEGTHPEADIVLTPTNEHATTYAEVTPNYISGGGTD